MNYKTFTPRQGGNVSLSALGLGNMRLPTKEVEGNTVIDRPAATALIDLAMAKGINYFDTAYIYHGGESESFLGEALVARHPRESFFLADKYHITFCGPDYKAVFEEQLRRLQTETIDFYLIHSVMDNTIDEYLASGCIEYFEEQRRQGRIRYLGFSSHASPEGLRRFADVHPWDFAQIQLNYLDHTLTRAGEQYEILKERNIPIMVMEPVRGGRLARLNDRADAFLKAARPEFSIPAWALRYVANLDGVQVVLSGMSNEEQLTENIATFSAELPYLTEKDVATLFQALEMFRSDISVPCTACRYCVERCPAGIDIPKMMEVYNAYRLDGAHKLKRTARGEAPSFLHCVGCGACVSGCPQSIAIPETMGEMAEKAKPFLE
ncbi:MAG: aldo/keto reductase [Clostridia bacterium]|nr:aldo/keto reductase [Clostridia bacterium]